MGVGESMVVRIVWRDFNFIFMKILCLLEKICVIVICNLGVVINLIFLIGNLIFRDNIDIFVV